MFCRTQSQLNNHIITEISWVVTMAPAVPSTDILRWPVASQWPSSRRLYLWRICYMRSHKLIVVLCNINEWWRWHRSQTLARFGRISYITWLICRCHRRGGHGLNFITAVTYSSHSNSKLYSQINNNAPKRPVELAQYDVKAWQSCA